MLLETDEAVDRCVNPGVHVAELVGRLEQGDEAAAALFDAGEVAAQLGLALFGRAPLVDGVFDLHNCIKTVRIQVSVGGTPRR